MRTHIESNHSKTGGGLRGKAPALPNAKFQFQTPLPKKKKKKGGEGDHF
jgi:hypothetical protein